MNREQILAFLSGGLGALVGNGGDGGQPSQGTAVSPPERPEQTPPEPQLRDREPFLMRVTSTQILTGTAVLVGAIALLAFARR